MNECLVSYVEVFASSLADQMRQLNYIQWMALLSNVFSNLLIIIHRVKVRIMYSYFLCRSKITKCILYVSAVYELAFS